MARKNISKKVRFEVFKRDSFTCQYCGKSAPDVVLNVDHIKPVSKGGKNDIMNLVTSCFDCNSGKRDRLLDDNSILSKQKRQLEELNEKRTQLEMMIEWREELQQIKDNEFEYVIKTINSNMIDYCVNKNFKKTIRSLLKKYGSKILLEAIDISAESYINHENEATYENYLSRIKGIADNLSKPPIEQKVNYVSGYASKCFRIKFWEVKPILMEYVKALQTHWEYDEDDVLLDLDDAVMDRLKSSMNYFEFTELIINWTNQIKKK